jgi:hypothetical protein
VLGGRVGDNRGTDGATYRFARGCVLLLFTRPRSRSQLLRQLGVDQGSVERKEALEDDDRRAADSGSGRCVRAAVLRVLGRDDRVVLRQG